MKQLDIGIPPASYRVSLWCAECQYSDQLNIGVKVLDTLRKVVFPKCGRGRLEVKILESDLGRKN